MLIWFKFMFSAVFKGLFPALLGLAVYYGVCRYFRWEMSGRIIYMIVAYAFLFGVFSSIGVLLEMAAIRP